MKKPRIPEDEGLRLDALDRLGLLYSPSEERFDRITKLACKVFDVPIALVSLVAGECQWFKSAQGITAAETSREVSFCGHAILNEEALVIPDAAADERFSDNPLVTGPPNIRFYAGHPVEYQGRRLGTLCLIDDKPRVFSMSEREDLKSLALWVQNEISVSALSETQIQLLKELGAVRRQSMLDPVTKTWNRQGLDELLPREYARARREQSPASIMIVEIQDLPGHAAKLGRERTEALLMEIAQRVRATVRPQDLMGRQADNCFLLFLSNCFTNCAAAIGQRISARVHEAPVDLAGETESVAVRIGIGSVKNAEDTGHEALSELATTALEEDHASSRGRRISIRTSDAG